MAMRAMDTEAMEDLEASEALDMVMDTIIILASELLRLMLNHIASMVALALETTLAMEAMALEVAMDMGLEATAITTILARDLPRLNPSS